MTATLLATTFSSAAIGLTLTKAMLDKSTKKAIKSAMIHKGV
jgi:hypothetical protein